MTSSEQIEAFDKDLWFMIDRFGQEFDLCADDVIKILASAIIDLSCMGDEEEIDDTNDNQEEE